MEKSKQLVLQSLLFRSKLYQSNSSVSLSDHDKISKDDIVRGLKLSTKFKKSHEEEVVLCNTSSLLMVILELVKYLL